MAIIVSDTAKNFLKRQDEFIGYFDSLPLDVNLVVYSHDEIERMSHDNNGFVKEIFRGIPLVISMLA